MEKTLELELNKYLSNIAIEYIKLHNLHWNVCGPRFKTVHEYLEVLYTALSDTFDAVAEEIKIQNKTPLASTKDYLKHASITELESKDYSETDVIKFTLADMIHLKQQVENIRCIADNTDNYSVVAMLEEQLINYNKTIWFLESMLK